VHLLYATKTTLVANGHDNRLQRNK
jgi:hypothetical protein